MDDTETLDRRILAYLQRNGRAGPIEIADAADTVATTVQKRLKAMEETGVVRGHQPRLDYAELGYPVTALLSLSVHDGAVRPFTARVSDDDRLVSVYELAAGPFNVLVVGKYPDEAAMDDHLGELVTDPTVKTGRANVVRRAATEYEPLDLGVDGATVEE